MGQSLRQTVTSRNLDGEVSKIMSPASPGMASPQRQETPDLHHHDNATSPTADDDRPVFLQNVRVELTAAQAILT